MTRADLVRELNQLRLYNTAALLQHGMLDPIRVARRLRKYASGGLELPAGVTHADLRRLARRIDAEIGAPT